MCLSTSEYFFARCGRVRERLRVKGAKKPKTGVFKGREKKETSRVFCGRFANIQKERGTASGKRLKRGEMAQTVVKQKSADESSSFFCWLFFLPKTPFLHWGKQRPRESGKAGAEYKKHQRQHHRYRHHRTNTVVNLPVLAKAKYTTSFKYHQLLIAYPLSPDTHNNRWKN